MLPLGPAIVMVMDPPMTRAAALVYRTQAGLGWVEPGYWDEDPPARSQWHEFAGEITDTENGVLLQSEQQTILVMDADRVRGMESDNVEAQQAIANLRARLKLLGTSLEEQRIRLAAELGAIG
jgi:hypothetical protein